MAEAARPIEGELAFMSGPMHDVGIAGILLALSEQAGRGGSPPALLATGPVLGDA